MRQLIARFSISLALLAAAPSALSAFPSYGSLVDRTCTANGWIPSAPFNPNQVPWPDPTNSNCGLCHVNASNPDSKLTTGAMIFKSSGFSDVSPFCQPPKMNSAPVFTPIAAQRVVAGVAFQLSVRASDPDGDTLTLSASGLPTGATFADQGGGVGLFTWTPASSQVGSFRVRFAAMDSGSPAAGAALDVSISVDPPPNRPPSFSPMAPQQTTAGQSFQMTVRASDPDGNRLALGVSNAPTGSTFSDRGDGSGAFGWTPARAQTGNFVVRFHATDDGSPPASGSLDVTIAVNAAPNQPPVFSPLAAQSVTAGQLLSFTVRATDPDGDALALSASNNPVGSTFADRGDGSGQFSWTPAATQVGNHVVSFQAVDGGVPTASATLDVAVSVGAVPNRPPVLDPIGNRAVNAGTRLTVAFTATDPDNDAITFSAAPLPPGATATTNGFVWTPTNAQAGNYDITATATDAGAPALSDSEQFVVTVGSVNRPPVLSPIGNLSALVGDLVRIALIASDPDGDAVALSCSGLPTDATFTDLGDRTGEIVWTPSVAGQWSAVCTALDSGTPAASDQQSFRLTASNPLPPPTGDEPAVTDVRWDGRRARVVLSGAAPNLPAGSSASLAIYARLGDGSDVLLGTRAVSLDASAGFHTDIAPFVPPCQVLVAAGGSASAPRAVSGAPARCDEQLLLQVLRARVSCDGRTLRVAGRRAPPAGSVVGSDGATGAALFSAPGRSNGSFDARTSVKAAPRSLRLEALSGGHRWALDALVPVTRDRCDD